MDIYSIPSSIETIKILVHVSVVYSFLKSYTHTAQCLDCKAFWTDACRSEHVQVAKMINFDLQQIHFKSENTHHVCNQNVCWQDTLTVSLEPLVRFILLAALLTSGHSAGASACFICIWKTLKHTFQQLTIANQQMFEQNHCLPDHGCGDQGACIMHEYSICVSTKTIFWMSSLFLSFCWDWDLN